MVMNLPFRLKESAGKLLVTGTECGSVADIRDCLEYLFPINNRRAEVVETVQ